MLKKENAVMPELNLESLEITISGVTSLITNRFSETALLKMEASQAKAAKNAKEPRNPEAEFLAAIHPIETKDKNVHGGFPAIGVKKAIVRAGTYADEKMTILRGAIQVMGDLLPIIGPKPVMRRDRVVLPGKTSIAYRPEFRDWSMPIRVTYNANVIVRDQVLNLFRIAGFSVGIGCWRPENDGTFGQFDVSSVATVKLLKV